MLKSKSLYTILAVILLASMALASCRPAGGETTVPTTAPTAAVTETAFEPMSVSADCEDANYTGIFKTIEAVDELTVRFTMCAPDPAFPSKVAFSSFAILSSEQLEAAGGAGDLLEKPIGTGPYMVQEWKRGDELVLVAFDNYWGEKAKEPTLVFRWSSEAAQRLLELQAGTVDGIDNVGPEDFAVVEGDSTLQLMVRPALNVFYVGMTNFYAPYDDERVRQAIAMGIDRQRIVDNFFPGGSETASHFTPCSIPNGCEGEPWYEFDPEAGRALLAEAGFPDGFQTTLTYRDVVRGYLPQPGVVAQDIQAQLKDNLNIDVEIVVMESGAFIAASNAGELEGLHLLGWGADYPDMTNFLDYHFGIGATDQFGTKFDDITDPLIAGAALANDAERQPFYEQANDAIRLHVPMIPISHGASAVAYRSVVEGGHVSPLGNEFFGVMSVPDKDIFVWMQNAEPISLYCADESDGESLRACEQVTEPLLGYEIGGVAVEPGLATACTPNADLTEWTCTLRDNVTFHDGSALDANDVVMTFVVQWDASHPLHVGNTGDFSYFSALWMGFLNAPPAE